MVLNSNILPLSIHDIDTLCQYYLALLYQNTPAKHVSNHINQTYGEILYSGVDKLLHAMTLSEKDIFIDYGSGLGKVVIQVFLKSAVQQAYGIEISTVLHQQAIAKAHQIERDLPQFYHGGRQLIFLQGDFLKIAVPKPTVALVTATCFTPSLLAALGKVIESTPSIHTVLSLRPIPTLQRLVFKKTIAIECSWDSALCYLYTLETAVIA